MACLYLFLSLITLVITTRADKPCSAFSVNGSYASTFSFYRFYDFRNASISTPSLSAEYWPTEKSNSPSLILSKSTNDSSWADDWTVRLKYKGAAAEGLAALHYIPQNVFMARRDEEAHLTLNTSRLANNTQQSGEVFFNKAKVDAISLRVSARVYGDSGAVAGFFIYHNDTQESDIEVLTRDGDSRVHFSNQPTTNAKDEAIAGAAFNESLPSRASCQDWTVYRLDWLPDHEVSIWYVNGQALKQTRTNVPKFSGTIFLDMWSNGGSWSGRMAVGNKATLEVQWIEMAFNASSAVENVPDNGATCTIDKALGNPVEASGTRNGPRLGVWVVLVAAAAWMMV
ncbi:concanavalin A-like lectin/glucanase domain-containing protein, partial [Dactylonectria macrodidyma]